MTATRDSGHRSIRSRPLGVVACLLVAGIGVGFLLSSALPGATGPRFDLGESGVQLPDPNERLAQAEAAAPYEVKLPASLPPEAKLEHVEWDTDIGGVVVIDLWFALASAGRLHIWQTNTASPVESIPEGEALTIGGRSWSRVDVDWGAESLIQLTTRFEGGVTVTVDAPVEALDPQALIDIAASIG